MSTPYTDALERALGRVIGDMQAKADLHAAKAEAVVAGIQAKLAEAEARIVAIEATVSKRVSDALDAVSDAAAARVTEALKAIERPDPAVLVQTVDGLIRSAVAEAVAGLPDVRQVVDHAVREAVAAIPAPRDGADGKDADPEAVRVLVKDAVAEAVAAIPAPRDGRDADPEVVATMVREAVAAIPAPRDGRDADPEVISRMIAEAMPPVESLRGPPGRLPVAKAWEDRVHYDGDVVVYRGATYQATRDTGRDPTHADWICLAARGEDGRSVDVRGTYDEAGSYKRLDIVALNGGSFIALCDDPGPCPGDGWQLLAGRGKPGQAIKGDKGDPGERGPKGDAGAPVVAGTVDGEGVITLTNGDGSTVTVDLYPVLANL